MLPLAPALVFLAVLGWRLQVNRGKNWRLSILEAATTLAAAVIAASELLSLGDVLKSGWIALGWTIAAALSLAVIWQTWSRENPARSRIQRKTALLRSRAKRPRLEWCAIYGVLIATGIIAWISPPTNFDSMTYQFPRVMHWLQQGSTDHYATSNVRQLSYGPGAVYWQSHLWSLWDGDRAACLVQWFASIGSGLALSIWIRQLVPVGSVGLAVLVGLTLPMGILQASSSQTDLQVTAWLLVAVTLMISAAQNPRRFVWAGLAFGLAVLTKPVAVLVGVPLALLVLFKTHRRGDWGPTIRAGLVTALFGLLVCAPHFWRNNRTFEDPLGPSAGTLLEDRSIGSLTSNTARWMLLNVPSLSAWQSTANVLQHFGINENDPATTYHGLHFSPARPEIVYRLLLPDEDFAAYTPTLILIGVLALIFWRQRDRSNVARPWLITIAVAWLLYPLMLQWQCWGNRLLLPVAWFALPLLLARTGVGRSNLARRITVIVLILQAGFMVGFSLNRPLVELPESWRFAGDTQPPYALSRDERFYLSYNAEAATVAQRFATLAAAREWRAIGLQTDWNYPEYVLWRALHQAGLDYVQVHHAQTVDGHGLEPVQLKFDGYVSSESALPPP